MKNSFFSKLSFKNTHKMYTYIKEAFKKAKNLKLFSLINRKSLIIKYIAVLLIIMIIPAAFGCFTTYLAVNSAKTQLLQKNNQAISHIQATIDTDLCEIIECMLDAANNEELLRLSEKPYSKAFIYEAASSELFPEHDNLKSSNIISKSAVYFDSCEMMISDDFAYDISTFFEEVLQTQGIPYEQLHALIKTTGNRRFVPAMNYYFNKKTVPSECMMYIQSFPTTSSPRGKLIVLINCRQLVKSFSDGFEDSNSCFFITDESGSLLYAVGNEALVSSEYLSAEDTYGAMEINGEEILYSTKNATYGNLKYIYAENASGAADDIKPIMMLTAIYVLFTLIIGSAVIVWLAGKNAQPPCDITGSAEDSSQKENTENEIENIQSADKDIPDEKVKSLPILEAGEQNMRKSIISNILRGEFNDTESIVKSCKKNGIDFVTYDFCVIYFNLNEIVASDIPIIKYAISNTVLEIFEPIAVVFIDDTEPASLVGIVNLKALDNDTERQIISNLEFLRNFFTEQFAASINVGVGNIVKAVESVASSYSNARDAAEYSILTGASDVLPYSRIKTRDYYYFYPLETESKLVSAVMSGDIEQVYQTIDHIVESNSMLSFDMYKCLFFDLTATALKIMSHKSIDISHIFSDNSSPFESLASCKNIKELTETVYEIFRKICAHTKDSHNLRKEKLKTSVVDFIQKNYTNPNMSLAMVADEFSMNYTYTSHFFKDFIGMNFIDYISDLRVKKAAELLRTTNMPIADIASAVGYANSTVLIKIFKKITNTTPGAYRKNIY